jgi:hypothetical protein
VNVQQAKNSKVPLAQPLIEEAIGGFGHWNRMNSHTIYRRYSLLGNSLVTKYHVHVMSLLNQGFRHRLQIGRDTSGGFSIDGIFVGEVANSHDATVLGSRVRDSPDDGAIPTGKSR